MAERQHPSVDRVVALLDSTSFTAVLTSVSIGTVFFGHAIRSALGWPGFLAALAVIVVMQACVIVVRRGQFEWHGILPVTLLAFVGWSALSVFWTDYQWATLGGVAYQLAIAMTAVFVAIARDLIQIIRALGDVLRLLLAASLVAEILSGVIFDVPFAFLGISGSLASGGPIQGLMGSRNMLGLVALVAALTFGVELLTRSIPRNVGIASLVVAAAVFGLTRSPVGVFIALGVLLAAGALSIIRRAPAAARGRLQIGLAAGAIPLVILFSLFRERVVGLINGGGELSLRLALWRDTSTLTAVHPLEGWGWVGSWRPELLPFLVVRTSNGRTPTSALSAYVDVWFQLGLVGFVIFVAFLGLALTRAWIVASGRRNVAHVWPALMLVLLAVASAAESSTLVEYCWFLLVVCAVKAAQELSWRSGLRRPA